MDNNLFRKQSLDHISTPDELHNYIRVTSPRLWMLLAVILALLVGLIAFSASVTVENTIPIKVNLESHVPTREGRKAGERDYTWVTANLPLSQLEDLEAGMTIRLGEEEGTLSTFSANAQDNQIYLLFEMDREYLPLKDGNYDAELVLESTTAINYLFP